MKPKLVVYSPHGRYLEADVKKRFEAAHPDLTLEFQDISGGEIFTRVKAEKARPGADVWWGGYMGDFSRAEKLGLLAPYAPAWADKLPAAAKSPTGGWTATFQSPEVIMYNSAKLKREDAPKNWDELLDPKWKGRIVIRDARPSTTMKTIFGAMILREKARTGGVESGFEFLKKLDANTGAYAANPEIMYDLLRSPETSYAVTLWTMADAPMLKEARGMPFDYILPPETPVLYEPIAILANAKNPAAAKRFYDFVNQPEQLVLMAKERQRIPVRTDIPPEQLPDWMRTPVKEMKLDWSEFDANIDEWILRWDSEIKGAK